MAGGTVPGVEICAGLRGIRLARIRILHLDGFGGCIVEAGGLSRDGRMEKNSRQTE